MNEAESVVIPNETDEALFSMEDLAAQEAEDNDIETVEDTTESTTEEVGTPTETKGEELDYTPFLDKLSKEIKYMDNEVKIESLDDVKTNYQKGLDYDRKVEKLKELESSEELTYIREKAKDNGMTPSEYIKALKDYEVNQAKTAEENEIKEMIENGVAENIARKVVETNRLAKELNEEKLRIKKEQEKIESENKKKAEDDKFFTLFPNVDVKSIPKEVYQQSQEIGLIAAYTNYENSQLKEKLKLLEKNQENDKSSPIRSTTEHGGIDIEVEDDFLKGFNIN